MPSRKKRCGKHLTLLLVFLMLVTAALPGCSAGKEDPMAAVRSYKDLNDPSYTIGVINGTIDGPVFEPSVSDDRIAWAILQHSVSNLTYTPVSDGVYTNLITIEQMDNPE